MKHSFKIIFLLFFVFHFGNAQKSLTGKVLNFKHKPVSKAMIYLDSISTAVTTDKEGNFSILLPEKVTTIRVYSKKYGWLASSYTNETKMDFIYLEKAKPQEAKTIADKSKSLEVDKDKNTVSYRTIYDMIRGRIAGVVVQPDNTIIIRGINSIKNNSEPLFVVDGNVVSSIDYIVPNEVKSITVLKDAEASIYGSRGSSGVIVIKLKN